MEQKVAFHPVREEPARVSSRYGAPEVFGDQPSPFRNMMPRQACLEEGGKDGRTEGHVIWSLIPSCLNLRSTPKT